jgi:hypothetical protein
MAGDEFGLPAFGKSAAGRRAAAPERQQFLLCAYYAVTSVLVARGQLPEFIENNIRKIDDWWRVPVRPSREPKHTFEYYDALARIKEEISEKTQLKVLLVPAMLE